MSAHNDPVSTRVFYNSNLDKLTIQNLKWSSRVRKQLKNVRANKNQVFQKDKASTHVTTRIFKKTVSPA